MNTELLNLLDKAIASCSGRDIVSTSEIVDILLDIRIVLTATQESELIPELEGA